MIDIFHVIATLGSFVVGVSTIILMVVFIPATILSGRADRRQHKEEQLWEEFMKELDESDH